MKKIIFFLIFILLFSFAACKEKECKQDVDCYKKGFTAKCVDYKCQFTPIPNFCGNMLCEKTENKCTCPVDCGSCSGLVQGSKYLEKGCIDDECLEDVPPSKISPITFNKEAKSLGDTFSIDIFFNQPFNIKKDLFKLNILLKSQGKNNKEEFIKNIEISARTPDRRTIVLARQDVNKHLWKTGDEINEEIILDFPTSKLEEELSSLEVKVEYEYVSKSLKIDTKKSGSFKVSLSNIKFIYVAPDVLYPCPASCDDYDPATRDFCDPKTHFCMHEPIPNTCGNFMCDADENKCTCPVDCGPCEGDVGDYLELSCEDDACIAVLKGVVEKKSILDERTITGIKLLNNYDYNFPFDVDKDSFALKFSIYSSPEDVSDFKIDSVRILSGTEELGKVDPKKTVIPAGITINAQVKPILGYEEDKSITLKIWYSYKKQGETVRGSFTESLGKVCFIKTK